MKLVCPVSDRPSLVEAIDFKMHTFHMRSSYAMLMDASVLATQSCHLDRKTDGSCRFNLGKSFLRMDFWEGTLNLAIILEIPKKADAEHSWRWSQSPFFPLFLLLFTNCCQIVTEFSGNFSFIVKKR